MHGNLLEEKIDAGAQVVIIASKKATLPIDGYEIQSIQIISHFSVRIGSVQRFSSIMVTVKSEQIKR